MTSAAEGSIQQRLEAQFEVTHQKPGRGNVTYITVEQVTSRLNEVLGFDGWDFTVREHGANAEADSIWCLGELAVNVDGRRVVKQQFGGQQIKRTDNAERKIIDYGDDLKAATSDALKKCAMSIGVGLYLSEKQGGVATQPRRQQQQPRAQQPTQRPAPPVETPPSNVHQIDQLKDCRKNGRFNLPIFLSRMKNRKLTAAEVALVAPHPSGNPEAMDVEGWLERHPDKTYYDLLDLAAIGAVDEPSAAAL